MGLKLLPHGLWLALAVPAVAQSIIDVNDDAGELNAQGGLVDCNSNGFEDSLDILAGTSTDCNNNAVPDECDIGEGIVFRGHEEASVGPGGTLTIARPTGTIVGDLLVAVVTRDGNNTIGTPTDWTPIDEGETGGTGGMALRDHLGVFYKPVGLAEPESYQLTTTAGEAVGAILAYSGAYVSNPIDADAFDNSQSNAPTAPAVIAAQPDSLVLRFYGAAGNSVLGGPAGHVLRFNSPSFGGQVSAGAADVIQPFAGSTGSAAFSLSSSQRWRAVTVVIRPAIDCNSNAAPDECDIASGTSSDCNANNVPDECEVPGSAIVDCNNNGLHDCIDIGLGTSYDCNSNGVPDECDQVPDILFASLSSAIRSTLGTTLSISTPAGTSAGDLLLAFVARDGSNSLGLPNPSGDWAMIQDAPAASNEARLGVAYKLASDSEPTSYQFTWTSSAEAVGVILRYSGTDSAQPIDAFGFAFGTTTNRTAPSVITSTQNSLVIRAYAADGSSLGSTPSGHTFRFRDNSSTNATAVNCGVADRIQAAPGATGAASFASSVSEEWRAGTVALRPGLSTDFNGNGVLDECEVLPARVYVNGQAAVSGDGSSWANPMVDLPPALSLAKVSRGQVNEIWVAEGTYKPSAAGDRSASFELVNGVGVYGGFAGNETALELRDPAARVTALSGDIGVLGNTADNSYHVVDATGILGGSGLVGSYFNNIDFTDLRLTRVDATINFNWGTGSPASGIIAADTFSVRWTGLVQAPMTGSWTFYANTNNGVRLWVDHILVIDHWVIDPSQENVGSIALIGGRKYSIRMEYFKNLGQANVELRWSGPGTAYEVIPLSAFSQPNHLDGFTITNGNAAGAPANRGGGLLADPGAPVVVNCRFEGNEAADGGAIHATQTNNLSITLIDGLFIGNTAGNDGGAFYGTGNLLNCWLLNNVADSGGAIYATDDVFVTNCAFKNNSATGGSAGHGGAVFRAGGTLTMTNATLVGNSASGQGGGVYRSGGGGGDLLVTNCILWQNSDDGGTDESAQITQNAVVTYSLVQGLDEFAAGIGNIDGDPLFLDPSGPDKIAGTLDDDLRLRLSSPCRDSGKNSALPPDTFDLDGDGNTAEPTPLDLAGRARFVDDPHASDCPVPGAQDTCGSAPLGDMGAFEGTLDCNANGFLDEDDVAFGTSQDCNDSLVPDECELIAVVQISSGSLGPIGAGVPRSYSLGAALPAAGDATLTFTVVADLSATDEWIDVTLGGISVGRILEAGGTDCPETPELDQLVVPQAAFNLALTQAQQAGDALVIDVTASPTVNPDLCGAGSIAVSLSYQALVNDCNQNGQLDECDIAAGTSQDLDFDGLPDECGLDCNNNGTADGIDLQSGSSRDCNSNGRPDECDIPGGDSLDCQANGIPDECELIGDVFSTWVGGTGLWNLAANWCPRVVPDNSGAAAFNGFVSDPDSLTTLNISPTIDSLICTNGAAVEVSDASGANSRTLAVDRTIWNTGTLRATDRERFVIDAPVIDQGGLCGLGGTLEATDGAFNAPAGPDSPGAKSILEINGARVLGGTARTIGTASEIHLIGGAELVDVCVHGVVVPDGQTGGFADDLVNDGLLRVAPGGLDFAVFAPSATASTLRGNGGGDDTLRLGGEFVATLGSPTFSFTNAAGHAINGAGTILGRMTNDGLVDANMPGQAIVLSEAGQKTLGATGVLRASNGGSLTINKRVNPISDPQAGALQAMGGTIRQVHPKGDPIVVRCEMADVSSNGLIELTDASRLELTGTLTVGPGGTVQGTAGVSESIAGSLVADAVLIRGSSDNGGELLLDGDMTLQVAGDLTMTSISTCPCEPVCPGPCCPGQRIRGFADPIRPRLSCIAQSIGDVNGSLRLENSAEIRIQSSNPFTLAGDFDNRATAPEGPCFFDWTTGLLTLDGPATAPQNFEAAGQDRGVSPDGFTANFAIGTLTLAPGTTMNLVDAFDNQQDGQAACEALYVGTLIVSSGAMLNTAGCWVYYGDLTNNGTIPGLGTDVLPIADFDYDRDGDVDLDDWAAFIACMAAPAQACLDRFDADHDQDFDLDDYGHFQRRFDP